MRDKSSPEKGSRISVSSEILKSANISMEQLQHYLIELRLILGTRFDLVIPMNIDDLPTLQWIISLSHRLQKLKQCDGFDRHIITYTRKQLHSSYFVTVIASYILAKVDDIILEPSMAGSIKKPDILANFRGEKVYLECKHIESSRFDYSEEHEHMSSVLRNYIDVPHQISITYKEPLADIELHTLGKTLQQRVNLVVADGRIVHNPNLEVQVIRRQAYADKRLSVTMSVITEDKYANCRYPGHIYIRNGLTLSLSGPKVDYSKVLKDKIRRSRKQSPYDKPYILIIDGNRMLGDFEENIRALSSAFQPKTNTRFSVAALVTYHHDIVSSGIDLNINFYLVSNPFAKLPISGEFERLLHTSPT
jgi:hypothetical protein